MSFNPTSFSLLTGLKDWAYVFGTFLLVVIWVVALTALVVKGRAGLRSVKDSLQVGLRDLVQVSPRRIAALTSLAFREAVRRKALLVFVIFALLFMFAGWFLSNAGPRSELQVKVYVSFVLRSISWLILPVVLLLSCWGLPEDIRLRSLHTVVTKPARRSEIVLGRMLGVGLVGTLVLAVMSSVGYIWLVRNVPAEARAALTCRVPVYGELRFLDRDGRPSMEGINVGDSWEFRSYIEGATRAAAIWDFGGVDPDSVLVRDDKTGEMTMKIESQFESFRTHKGNMDGGLLARYFFVNPVRSVAAEALFQTPPLQQMALQLLGGQFTAFADALDDLAEGLDQEEVRLRSAELSNVSVSFRGVHQIASELQDSHSDLEWLGGFVDSCQAIATAADAASDSSQLHGLPDALRGLAEVVRDNEASVSEVISDLRVPYRPFEVKEYRDENVVSIPRTLTIAETGKSVDLFEDLAPQGRLRIEVRCLDPGQCIGMARPDLFLRTPDRPFWIGYSKAIFSIWLMMLVIVVIGVSSSCFLKGPVATMLTIWFIIVGQVFGDFLDRMLAGQVEGGGTFESAVRLAKHMNPKMEMTESSSTTIVRGVDRVMEQGLWMADKVAPDFSHFSRTSEYLANGFDIPWSSGILPCVATALAYIVPCLLIGYFSLKTRELEAK